MTRESMEFDVIIVGAGPAGLSAAIRLAQLGQQHNQQLNICIIEKGADVSAQTVSGAVLEPRALNELINDWQSKNAPLTTPATQDQFLLFTEKKSYRLPTPSQMHNQGNYIISLGKFCRWLAEQAEILGVNIFPSFAATEIIYENDKVVGVITGDKGIDKQGNKTSLYQAGMELRAKQVFFAEGCRGSLTQTLFERFDLRKNCDPQTYGLGIKELWEIPEEQHQAGLAIHSIGWPLDNKTYGGSFVYHFEKNLVEIGFVVGLDYQNPYLNPYEEFQRFKTHPRIASLLENGKRICYGARALNEGGWQSLPKLTFPGGLIVGDAAGFLNVPKIKGIHTAMKSGMIAAESVFPLLQQQEITECVDYETNIRHSWIAEELYKARNIRPAMNWGLWIGLAYSALDTYILRGKAPWTLHNHADYKQLRLANACEKIDYPKHDNKITFDLMTSVFLTNSIHDENQPCHLLLKDPASAIDINYKLYASPETRYCPAGVYEIVFDENNSPRFHMNYSNCIQCKACDIKDPTQNIKWTPPEGGSGPQYGVM
ncbi:MAG: electron transfer flavoprotein-ubiquinone oxidoreductase [Gammaproteobacteria bacterium]